MAVSINNNLTAVQPISGVSQINENRNVNVNNPEIEKAPSLDLTIEEKEVNVISKSNDGDTLTGEPKTSYSAEERMQVIADSEDGTVSKIDKVPDDEELITNLTGYTKAQVERLYREGQISRYAYEQDVTKREERLEEMNPIEDEAEDQKVEADNQFTSDMIGLIGKGTVENLEANALTTAAQNDRTELILDIFAKQ